MRTTIYHNTASPQLYCLHITHMQQAKQARSHLPKIQLGCLGGCSWWDFDLASLVPRLRPTIDNRATNRDWKQQQLYGESSFRSRDLMHTTLVVDNCTRAVAVMCISSFPKCQVLLLWCYMWWSDAHCIGSRQLCERCAFLLFPNVKWFLEDCYCDVGISYSQVLKIISRPEDN